MPKGPKFIAQREQEKANEIAQKALSVVLDIDSKFENERHVNLGDGVYEVDIDPDTRSEVRDAVIKIYTDPDGEDPWSEVKYDEKYVQGSGYRYFFTFKA